MNTELNDRNLLITLISSLREDDLKQLMAFAKGYEAGNRSRQLEVFWETQNKDQRNSDRPS